MVGIMTDPGVESQLDEVEEAIVNAMGHSVLIDRGNGVFCVDGEVDVKAVAQALRDLPFYIE